MNQETDGPRDASKNELFDDFLLSLNLGASFACTGLIFALLSADSITNISDAAYLALRSVYRVSDFLRFSSVNPVSTGAVRREMPGHAEELAMEITLLLTGLAAMAFVLLLLRSCSRAQIVRRTLNFEKLGILLFAGPVTYLLISWWTWNRPLLSEFVPRGIFYLQSLPFLVFLAEFLCLGAMSFRSTRRRSGWTVVMLTVFHWVFWVLVLWKKSQMWVSPLYARNLLLILLPASTLMWIWREKRSTERLAGAIYGFRNALYALSAAAVVFGVAVWHPARTVELSHPREWKTVEVEVARGPCYGSCPVYTVSVRGDGRVEYVGREGHSRTETRKSGSIGQGKILEILRNLDRAEFTILDGRAFRWAFDTPSIGVRASVDGKSKEVVSDFDHDGSATGRQVRFLEAAEEIDTILKATAWTKCEGECGASERGR